MMRRRRPPSTRPLLIAALVAVRRGVTAAASVVLGWAGSAPRSGDVNVSAQPFRGNVPSAVFVASDFTLRDALSGMLVRMSE